MANLKEPGPIGSTGQPTTTLNDGTINLQPTPLPGTTGAGPATVTVPAGSSKTVSGKYWVTWADTNAKNSDQIEDLEEDFRGKVKEFKKALEDAGAKVEPTTTTRSDKRAYLFHWSWKIALGK